MDIDKLSGEIALVGIISAFVFAVCSGVYLTGISLYNYLRRNKDAGPFLRATNTPRNLRASSLFFGFVGIVAIFVGAYTWKYQPADRQQAMLTFISAVFFIAWAFAAYKKV